MSDEYLLDLALEGDGGCFGELVRRWEGRIFGFIRKQVGNTEVAKDLTQNTFTKAYENLGRLSDPARFSSWLYTIALNECRMRFRRRKGRYDVPLEDSAPEVERRRTGRSSPEQKTLLGEELQQLRASLDELPAEQKEVIIMKEFQDLRFKDIAEILEIPLSTAKSRLYLGLKNLRRLMEAKQ